MGIIIAMLAVLIFFYILVVYLETPEQSYNERFINSLRELNKMNINTFKLKDEQEDLKYFFQHEVLTYSESDPGEDIIVLRELLDYEEDKIQMPRKKLVKINFEDEIYKIQMIIKDEEKNKASERSDAKNKELKRLEIISYRKKFGLDY